jgi:hypothetical protein
MRHCEQRESYRKTEGRPPGMCSNPFYAKQDKGQPDKTPQLGCCAAHICIDGKVIGREDVYACPAKGGGRTSKRTQPKVGGGGRQQYRQYTAIARLQPAIAISRR